MDASRVSHGKIAALDLLRKLFEPSPDSVCLAREGFGCLTVPFDHLLLCTSHEFRIVEPSFEAVEFRLALLQFARKSLDLFDGVDQSLDWQMQIHSADGRADVEPWRHALANFVEPCLRPKQIIVCDLSL